jgi:hypothetical protein
MANFILVHARLGRVEILLNRDYVVLAQRIEDKTTKEKYTIIEFHDGRKPLEIIEEFSNLVTGQPKTV